MRSPAPKLSLRIVLFALICGLLSATAGPAQAAWAKPSGLRVEQSIPTAFAVTWSAVGGAPGYRVAYSSSSSWTSPRYQLTGSARAELLGLEPGTTYYVKVRVAELNGTDLGPYSASVAVTLASAGSLTSLSPGAPDAVAISPDTVTLGWPAKGSTGRYRVQYATTPSMAGATFLRVSGVSHTLTGLKPATRYWVKVRVIDAEGTSLSRYSAATTLATPSATASPTSFKPPTSLAVTSRSRSALQVGWKAVSGAAAYRVKYASSSSWSGAKYVLVTGPAVELTGLSSSRTYYVKARVVTANDEVRSDYSTTVKTSTLSSGSYPYLRPAQPSIGTLTGTTAVLTWPSRGSKLTYRVRYDTDSGYASPSYAVVSAPSVTLSGLLPNIRYTASVRVVGAKNTPTMSEYSVSTTLSTPTVLAPLRVASYNVKAHNSFHALPNEGTWLQRRAAVTALIRNQAPDVLSLQEAQQSRIRNADGSLSKIAQMEDLVARLGSPYKLVNPSRYDCVKATTMTRCVKKDREASRGVRIVYNSVELELKNHGARRLSYVDPDDMERYVSWAILRQRDSGKSFMVVDVHFENTADLIPGSTSYYELLKTQTRESLAEVKAHNPDRLPVIFTGDLQATRNTVPDNAPYDLMRAAGYTDPLGNTWRSTTIAPWATAEVRINAQYNSYNHWQLSPPKSSYPNGSYYDYILTSGPFRVSEWETAMTLKSDGTYAGVIPSDHHLIRATVWLP